MVGVGPSAFHEHLQHDPTLAKLPPGLKYDWAPVRRDLHWLQTTKGAQILTLADQAYPERLRHINKPPPILYVLGDGQILQQAQLAVVGSRRPTPVGRILATELAGKLANYGLVITSGLATGIDTAGHLGALQHGGHSVAVLGHGLEKIYPSINKQLSAQIIERGCLVSEFAIGSQMLPGNFVRRNRIISGLSLGVLVVEAAINSGSLSTAAYAREQNREVFAVPGSVHSPNASGCHQLIKQGAKLVESVEDVLEELANLFNCVIRDKNASLASPQVKLTVPQAQVFKNIGKEVAMVDELVVRSGLVAAEVGAILVELELMGLIRALPGGYARVG